MKRILIALMAIGLMHFSANAGSKNCVCKTNLHKTVHKTSLHRTAMRRTSGLKSRSIFTATSNTTPNCPVVPAVQVIKTGDLYCTTQKQLDTDPLAGIMAPVVTETRSTVCTQTPYFKEKVKYLPVYVQ